MKKRAGTSVHAQRPSAAAGGDLYRLIFEQARDSILLLELPSGRTPVIRDANPAALALHGYSRSELAGKPVTVLGASLGRGRLASLSGGAGGFEVRQLRRDGSPLATEVTARNVRLGDSIYGIVVERDVTSRLEQQEEGRRVSARIMLAREEEKKRLAASLHDAIGAMQVGLSSALLLLGEDLRLGRKRAGLARVAETRRMLKTMTADLKGACVESWPPGMAVSGLGAALKDLLAAFERRSGIAVSASVRLPERGRAARSPLGIVLYRLAQEALRNAEKHSGAGSLEFLVECGGGWMTLTVRDDGRGFDPAGRRGKKDSLGLKMMAEAAESAGGYFSVYSRTGAGTTLKAELPLARGGAR
ncbi:MAG: ATP-binding protein [Elusimicrobiales bacterium]